MSDDNKSGRVVVKKKVKKQNLKTFVTGILRRASFHWRPRNEALVNARVSRGRYLCASCNDLFGPKEVIIDHIEPVVDPKVGFISWDVFIPRLLCPVENFQILCHACSDSKTQIEDHMREYYKTQKEELPDLTAHKQYTKKKLDKQGEKE